MSKQNRDLVLEYLLEKNRPLNSNDILEALSGKITKANLAKTLDELFAEKKINEKTYGKSKVYMTLQTVDTTNIKSDLRALDEKVFTCRNELTLIRNENSRLESAMKGYSDKIPLPDLERSVKSLDDEVEELKLRLHDLKSAKTEVYTKQEKLKIQKEHEKCVKDWRKTRRIANEMMSVIIENCGMKKAQICDDIGVVLDEHEGVELPQI